ncbi:hypothetical protein H6G76_35850 [Nostoc sp. FACHB-152]|uniref:hypothetical protein n=1 Tax=unclassified Nostoc TaxID=2593658 RepID=UPI0016851B29|nr:MULTISPECIES: hypothetical protein [unclassified Nostoc]MBD2452383.1 hypothetical protein [Nostoc sp. FACHB-152]MBD2473292.1 hypothetical protein [Nostoc sp. FACHB-145]
MSKVSISIQLSDAEVKALSAMQISENESLNQTATRLLKGILGQSKAGQTLSDDQEIKQILKQELTSAIDQIKDLITQRPGEVNSQTQEAVSVVQQSKPDYEAIRSNVLSQMKVGKQSAAKAIDAFIEELDAASQQQKPETEELDVAS